MDQIRFQVMQLLKNYSSVQDIQPTSDLVKELKMDSFKMLSLLFDLEEAFSLSVEDGAIAQVKTVDDICVLIESKLKDAGMVIG